ncbi:MAG: glutamate 5-kinase [Clostridiales bacterium]|jgi:glutamate 5-kinase|nr:glutamate 5-kinase [Clostridiales bacterium]
MICLKDMKRIVVKVGTSTLTYENGKTNIKRMRELVRTICDFSNFGLEVALVTSGAIGIGVGKLGLCERPKDTPSRQAAACVGQCELMFMYDKFFQEYGNTVGQLLITKSDIEDKERGANLINAFEKIFLYGAIPIINENDSVAVEEIVYGDNDNLSAHVARLIAADLLIILTDTDGLFDKNPHTEEDAVLIPVVNEIDGSVFEIAEGKGSSRGTGGMFTKIQAAKLAGENGIPTIIMNGENPEDMYRLMEGRQVGTLFTV